MDPDHEVLSVTLTPSPQHPAAAHHQHAGQQQQVMSPTGSLPVGTPHTPHPQHQQTLSSMRNQLQQSINQGIGNRETLARLRIVTQTLQFSEMALPTDLLHRLSELERQVSESQGSGTLHLVRDVAELVTQRTDRLREALPPRERSRRSCLRECRLARGSIRASSRT